MQHLEAPVSTKTLHCSWAILAGITADSVLSKVISIILSLGNLLTSSKETKYLEGSYPFWSHWSSVSLYWSSWGSSNS